MNPLEGRRIVITGAGRGLGRAYALAVAHAGGKVVVNDVDQDCAEAVCADIREFGGTAHASAHSVSDPMQAEALVTQCVTAFGGLDGLVNNAGLFHARPFAEEASDEMARLIAVNVLGVMYCSQAAIRAMSPKGGVLVNVVSGAALGIPKMATYGASKGAVMSLTWTLAKELEDTKIRVCGLSPVAATRMTQSYGASTTIAAPEAIAPLVVYLLSDAAAHWRGAVIRLAGDQVAVLEPPRFGPVLGELKDWDQAALCAALAPATGPASE